MKLSTKIIAILLAVLMTAPLLLVPSFAAGADEDPYAELKEGTGYVAIGDSFTRGYGAGENWQNQIYENEYYGNYDCRNVDGSYPNLVAEKFGLNAPNDIRDTSAKLWPIAHDAVSVAYMLDFLGIDDGFRDDEFTYQDGALLRRYATDLKYFGDPLSYTIDGTAANGETGEIMSIRDMIKDASLITIGLGQTDVIYKAQIFGFNKLDLSDTASLPEGILNILKLLNKYYDYWQGAFPLLLNFIKEVNPDAKVVLVGTLNPIKNATLKDDSEIQIGNAITGIMDSMNAFTSACAVKYGYKYVDISDVETPTAVTQMSISQILSISDPIEFALVAHPTPKGYSQIAEKIIAAVESDLGSGSLGFLSRIKNLVETIIDWLKIFYGKIVSLFGSFGK